ncbi:MAG: phosphoribosylglycinamide formyltransferase [Gammaproteobacteria bacterium]
MTDQPHIASETAEHPRRLAVLVSGNGSNLQALIDSWPHQSSCQHRGQLAALERAQQAGIPQHVIDHTVFSDRAAFDTQLSETLLAHRIDLIVLAGFMRILTDHFISTWQGRIVNVHPSLLPEYRGLHTHQRVLADGKTQHGCSVHWVVPELDAGPLIAQARLPILPNDTPASLQNRVQDLEHKLYPFAIAWVLNQAELPYNTSVNSESIAAPLGCLEAETLQQAWQNWQETGRVLPHATS